MSWTPAGIGIGAAARYSHPRALIRRQRARNNAAVPAQDSVQQAAMARRAQTGPLRQAARTTPWPVMSSRARCACRPFQDEIDRRAAAGHDRAARELGFGEFEAVGQDQPGALRERR